MSIEAAIEHWNKFHWRRLPPRPYTFDPQNPNEIYLFHIEDHEEYPYHCDPSYTETESSRIVPHRHGVKP